MELDRPKRAARRYGASPIRWCELGRPTPAARTGVGPIVAATVLCAWSHPGR
jgi:hypothetical protein